MSTDLNSINPKADAPNLDLPSPGMIAAGLAIAVEANSTDAISDETVASIYSAMRKQFNKEQELIAPVGVSVEMFDLLRTSTITTYSDEKMIVEGNRLLIEGPQGEVLEERALVGREAQLIGTIMINQRYYDQHTIGKEWIVKNPDEPYFILLGRDPQAPDLVRTWANDRLKAVTDDLEAQKKAHSAFLIASAMQQYKLAHPEIGMPAELHAPALSMQDFLARFMGLIEEAGQYDYLVLVQLKPLPDGDQEVYHSHVEVLTRDEAVNRIALFKGEALTAIDAVPTPDRKFTDDLPTA